MISERPLGRLPSNTKENPREHAKAVTLRSGKELTIPTPMVMEKEKEPEKVPHEAGSPKEEEERKKDDKEVKKKKICSTL